MAVAAQSAAQRDIIGAGDGGATLSAAFSILCRNVPLVTAGRGTAFRRGATLCVWMCVLCVHSGLRWM